MVEKSGDREGVVLRPAMRPLAWLVALAATVLLAGPVLAQSAQPTPTPAAQEIPRVAGSEVVVTAPRIEVPLKENPAATTVVSGEQLANQPKTINAKEVLLLVPGVKVDDQANGERVHMSIRGQGILTERGIRGIKVLLDGLPLNDPTGFAPDLFDVDWATVKRVEVFRGPASALWGGGASGGILNIETRDGGPGAASGEVLASAGSHGFWKVLTEVGGTDGNLNYRVSGSRMMLDGYRVHTAAHATNLYGKFRFDLGGGDHITAIIAGTSYFNENAEGLNIAQVRQDPRQPNPDALTFNEFQRTRRATLGVTGNLAVSAVSGLEFALYARHTEWQEAVPSSVDHRAYDSPGGFLQYSFNTPLGPFKNHLSLGADLDLQTFNDYQRPNLGRAREGAVILADQDVHQRGTGVYLLDQLELSPQWSVMAGVRSDSIDNTLTDLLRTEGVDHSGSRSFSKSTGRIGVAWNPVAEFGAYASWAQGFLPPATEELAHNPDAFGGFNEHLVPATSRGVEAGVRGALGGMFTYDVAVFRLLTDNDFGRYRVASRPLETFYNNAGSSRRFGVETLVGFYPSAQWSMELAYTYSHFRYDHALFSGVTYYDTPLPNSPDHMATLDTEYRITPDLAVGLEAEIQSRAYVDPTSTIWVGGYTLLDARLSYRVRIAGAETVLLLYGRNLTGKKYIAFTEPDPDGNSYQPGPEREVFGGVQVHF
ncbi:MAG: TonB-dependent receptor family protein [Acidobacteriota bacterium]